MDSLKTLLVLLAIAVCSLNCPGHDLQHEQVILHTWTLHGHTPLKASFLMYKDGQVYLQVDHAKTVHFPLSDFSTEDQQRIVKRYSMIEQLQSTPPTYSPKAPTESGLNFNVRLLVWAALLFAGLLSGFYFRKRMRITHLPVLSIGVVAFVCYSFSLKSAMQLTSITDPLSVDSAFTPFKPQVNTSWDSSYFYVESHGIPTTHPMMAGITSWQQQVPIPQCYIKPNAWMIPLNPVVAATPVPVDPAHFTRGAIAVAINGVPIFNPYTNTGVDAYLDGQLDQWGGHCGRADDYHYHIAPMQLYNHTPSTWPIAFALDGFAVYGTVEPDGSPLLPLDANHGHYWTNGVYHYHGTATPVAPYMIANMVGQVTEDATHQIIPQPHAQPVRPALTPLPGALITACIPNSNNNGYTVTYTVGGTTDSIVFFWNSTGLYTFNFYSNGILDSSRNYNGFNPCQLPTALHTVSPEATSVMLFPNPARETFSLVLNPSIQPTDVHSISMYNAKGEIVYTSPVVQQTFRTDAFPAGVYFVVVKTTGNTVTKKLVID